MVVRASGEGAYEFVVHDDSASVCSGAPSTMTGTGRLDDPTTFVIPSPAYTCDDESEPKSLSGPPLEEQLRNLTFVHDPQADTLTDSLGAVWNRHGATVASGGMWPQSNAKGAERAQRLADDGDARYTWQVFPEWPPYPEVKPGDPEIFNRFLQEELGWEAFSWGVGHGLYPPEDWPWEFVVVRCAPGSTNAMYPNDSGRSRVRSDDRREPVRDGKDQRRSAGTTAVPPGSGL